MSNFSDFQTFVFFVQFGTMDELKTQPFHHDLALVLFHQLILPKFCFTIPSSTLINSNLLPELFWPTVRKKCSSDREKLLKFEAEGQEFANILRSLEQFIQTVKG